MDKMDSTPEELLTISEQLAPAIFGQEMATELASFMAAMALTIQDIINGDCPCQNCTTIKSVAANVPV